MTCEPEKIYLYLEEELSEPERAQVEAHLQECTACADRLLAQRAVLDDLDGLLDVTTPAWLEQEIIERTYDDLTATFQSQAERGRALMAVGALSAAAVVLLSLNTVADYLLQFLVGLRAVGSVLWDITTIVLKGLSLVTIGLFHGLTGGAPVTPLPAILIAAMLSLMLARLVLQFDVSANKQ